MVIGGGVDGSEDGLVPLYGAVFVGPSGYVGVDGSYLLLTAEGEGGPVLVYERNSIGGGSTRTEGAPYAPTTATLSVAEQFGKALAASGGWSDIGVEQRDGLTLHHLRAATTGLTDAGLFTAAALYTNTPAPGQLDAWVRDDGQPVALEYKGTAVDLTFHLHVYPSAEWFHSWLLDPWTHHKSAKFGYAFDLPAPVALAPAPGGEAGDAMETYCNAKQPGGLAGWVAYHIRENISRWGKPGSATEVGAGVTRSAAGFTSGIPAVVTTWTDATAATPEAILVASFATRAYYCDLLVGARTDAASVDEMHAILDRMLLSLKVSH
jgi:hypothetical protein